jgi:lycopene cyclase domain-containing protein
VNLAYLGALLLSGGGLALVDRRRRLLFWHDARRAAVVVATGVAVLLAADLVGIAHGLFFRAPTRVMTGLLIAPELPVEEPVFLAFLCYLTMLLVRGTERVLAREGTP